MIHARHSTSAFVFSALLSQLKTKKGEGVGNGKNPKQCAVWKRKKEAFGFLKDGEGKTLREFSEQRFPLRVNTSPVQIPGKKTFHRMFKVTKIL